MEDIQIQKDLISIYLNQLLNDPDEVLRLVAMKSRDEEIKSLQKEIGELKEEILDLRQCINQILNLSPYDSTEEPCISTYHGMEDQVIDQGGQSNQSPSFYMPFLSRSLYYDGIQ